MDCIPSRFLFIQLLNIDFYKTREYMFHIVNNSIFENSQKSINVSDRGFTLGHGLFETILSVNGNLPFLNYHWERLIKSAEKIFIKIDLSYEEFRFQIQRLLESNKLLETYASVRLTVTHGEANRGIFPIDPIKPNIIYMASKIQEPNDKPLTAKIVNTKRNENSISCQVKSISYLDNIMAKKEAIDAGYDEAILLNSKGFVAEGSITNIFVVKDDKIFTPTIESGALPGITRRVLLNDLHLDIKEMDISVDFLFNSDEVFVTNSLMGIKVISKIDKQEKDSVIIYNQVFR
tara:strand:- start:40017 stop:40889 length:873 start_codon:yes stop_codon:yes gene_type:complete